MSCWLTLICVGENHHKHDYMWRVRESEKTGWLYTFVENHSEKCSLLTQAQSCAHFSLSRSFFILFIIFSTFIQLKIYVSNDLLMVWYIECKKKLLIGYTQHKPRQWCVLKHGELFSSSSATEAKQKFPYAWAWTSIMLRVLLRASPRACTTQMCAVYVRKKELIHSL
jgi:hypothetical protein